MWRRTPNLLNDSKFNSLPFFFKSTVCIHRMLMKVEATNMIMEHLAAESPDSGCNSIYRLSLFLSV